MSVLDYAALETALLGLLQADSRLAGVTIDNGGGEPTAETCPFIGIGVTGFERAPYQLTGGLNAGGPYLETVTIAFDCWQFSGQGGGAARAAVLALADTLLTVLGDSPTLSGRVMLAQALRGQISVSRAGQGIFGNMTIEMQAQKFTP